MLVALAVYPNVAVVYQSWWQGIVNPFKPDLVERVPQVIFTASKAEVANSNWALRMYESPSFPAIIEYTDQIGVPKDPLLSIRLERTEVPAGEDVTFLVTKTSRILGFTGLYVFIVDPFGIVRGAFPHGETQGTPHDPYSEISADVRDSMQNGRVAFTFRIPPTTLSIGKWVTYILGAPSTNWAAFVTWTAASFMVQPQGNTYISLLQDVMILFGTPLTVYRLVISESFTAALRRIWQTSLRKDWPLLLGIGLMAGYLILKYLFH